MLESIFYILAILTILVLLLYNVYEFIRSIKFDREMEKYFNVQKKLSKMKLNASKDKSDE